MTKEKRSAIRIKNEAKIDEIINSALELLRQDNFSAYKFKDFYDNCSIPKTTYLSLVPNVETLICYLAIHAHNNLLKMYNKSNEFAWSSGRENFFRYYLSFILVLSNDPTGSRFLYEELSSVFLEKADSRILAIAKERQKECVDVIYRDIVYSIERNELLLPPRLTAEALANFLYNGHKGVVQFGLANDLNMIAELSKYKYYIRFCVDNIPWHPTTDEMDYDKVMQKLVMEFYQAEFSKMPKEIQVNIK